MIYNIDVEKPILTAENGKSGVGTQSLIGMAVLVKKLNIYQGKITLAKKVAATTSTCEGFTLQRGEYEV